MQVVPGICAYFDAEVHGHVAGSGNGPVASGHCAHVLEMKEALHSIINDAKTKLRIKRDIRMFLKCYQIPSRRNSRSEKFLGSYPSSNAMRWILRFVSHNSRFACDIRISMMQCFIVVFAKTWNASIRACSEIATVLAIAAMPRRGSPICSLMHRTASR